MRIHIKLGVLLALLNSCSQEPSFQEDTSVRTVDVAVEGGSADAVPENGGDAATAVDENEANVILDDLDKQVANEGSSDPATSGDVPVYGDGDPATDGSDSSADDGGDDTATDNDGNDDTVNDDDKPSTSRPDTPTPDKPTKPRVVPTKDPAPKPSKSEAEACAKLSGVDVERVKVVGDETSLTIESGAVLAFKVVGNKSRLALNLRGETGGRIGAVCVFLAGNRPRADIVAGLEVGRLTFVARGNEAVGDVDVQASGSLKALTGDLAGHHASLNVHGAGAHPCETVRLRGSEPSFVCK